MNQRLPLSQALLWIFLSTLLFTGLSLMCWLYYLHIRQQRETNEQYHIVALVQNCSGADSLKSIYLCELLDLSLDAPTNLYSFNLHKNREKLLQSPVIKEAVLKKIFPSAVYVDYEMRQPYAYLGEFNNAAIDSQGVIFPVNPFYTPKKLPILYLGLKDSSLSWGSNILSVPAVKEAFSLMQHCQDRFSFCADIKSIDVSKMKSENIGEREILIKLAFKDISAKNEIFLRLSVDHVDHGCLNFLALYQEAFNKPEISSLLSEARVIDLRLDNLAFLSK